MSQVEIKDRSPQSPPYKRHRPGRPQLMGRVLGIVYWALSAQLIQKAGFTRKRAQTGAVTLIQRFGSALNLNVHFHGAHPCAPPCGRPMVVQIGFPADLSYAISGRCLHHHALG